MKTKLYITFEVETEVEVDVPEHHSSTSTYVVSHKDEIVAAARKKIIDEGIENQLTWENFTWRDSDTEIDLTDIRL